jgi:hypothetical protein
MTTGEEIIAHGAVVPLPCLWGDQRLKIVHLIDWAARADSTGAGMSLMTRVRKMTDGIFAAGGSTTTEKILPALGFKESRKAAPFVRPLRPSKVLFNGRESLPKSIGRYARGVLWRLKAPRADSGDLTSRHIPARDLAGTTFPFPHPTPAASMVFERSHGLLAWFLECPSTTVELYMVESDGKAVGYFLLSLVLGQGRIADAWIESDREEDWAALYLAAVERCRTKTDIAEVATVATTDVAIGALQAAGFQRRGEIALRFLVRGTPPADIRYQLLDGEAAYLHDGYPEFWS